MLHEPAQQSGEDRAAGFKSRLGVKLFIVYGLVYAGFIVINVVNPELMETIILAGLNLAVVYGVGLIVVALVLALIYDHACGKKEKEMHQDEAATEKEGA